MTAAIWTFIAALTFIVTVGATTGAVMYAFIVGPVWWLAVGCLAFSAGATVLIGIATKGWDA